MESETALVRSQGRVELDPEAAVHLHHILVVLPHDAELHHALGDGGDGEGGLVFGVLGEEGGVGEGGFEF